jgi:hypothetical protein
MIILSKIFDKLHFLVAVDNVLRQRCVIEFGMKLGKNVIKTREICYSKLRDKQ